MKSMMASDNQFSVAGGVYSSTLSGIVINAAVG